MGQIGDGSAPDLVAVAVALTQEHGGWRGAVRNDGAIHARIASHDAAPCQVISYIYMPTQIESSPHFLDPVYSVGDFALEVRPMFTAMASTGLFGRTVLSRMREASSHVRISSGL